MQRRTRTTLFTRTIIFGLTLLVAVQLCASRAVPQSRAQESSRQRPTLWGDLRPGAHAIGFKQLNLYDHARTFTAPGATATHRNVSRSRPVPVSVWYPAARGTRASFMRFEEYVFTYNATLAESYRGLTREDKARLRSEYAAKTFDDVPIEKVATLLDTATATTRDAPPDRIGRFPVILYAPGWGSTPLNHTVTCEYLASHGYIVASTSARGTASVMTLGIRDVEAQTRDLEFMLAALHDSLNADTTRVAAIGFSLGDAAALLVAMRNGNVRVVVSLDGTTGFKHYQGLHEQSTSFDTGRMRAAFLHMNAQGKAFTDLDLINSLKYAERFVLSFKGFGHTDFIAGKMIARIARGAADPNYERGYVAVCEYTHRFLDAYMKSVGGDRTPDMRPSPTLAADNFLVTQSFKALPPPPTEEEFARLIMQPGGVTEARRIYETVKRDNPEGVFFRESLLEALGINLLEANRAQEAVEVCLLNVEAHPGSYRARNNLGEAFAAHGDKEKAIENYNTSLKLKPGNVEAIEALKGLNGKPSP